MAKQSRAFSVLLYPDSEDYSCDTVISRLDATFEQWAYILHDSDVWNGDDEAVKNGKYLEGEHKKDHIHIVGRCSNPLPISTISNKLGIAENFIEFSKGTFKKAVRYLVHLDHEEKYQYDKADITSNFDFGQYFGILSSTQQAKSIYQVICGSGITSKRVLLEYCLDNGLYSEYCRGYRIWSDIMVEIYNDKMGY